MLEKQVAYLNQKLMLAHRKISNFIARGILKLISFKAGIYTIQGAFLSGETISDLQHPQEYGFASKANLGAYIVALFNGGNRDHGQALIVYDPSVTPADLGSGDSCQYDASNNRVWLKGTAGILIKNGDNIIVLNNNGIIIEDTNGNTILMQNGGITIAADESNPVIFNSPVVFNEGWTLNGGDGVSESGSNISINGTVSDSVGSMQRMRDDYNAHLHPTPAGDTGLPTVPMD